MNPPLSFFVVGTPAPGGSKSAIPIWRKDGSLVTTIRNGRVWPIFNMIDAGGERNDEWKRDCKQQARHFMQGAPPFDVAMKVELVFFMQRPLKHFIANDRSRPLREDAPAYVTKMPDALKLARSTEDAFTGIIWVDDSQTVRICSEKKWCGPEDKPGCAVKIILLASAPVQDTLL